MRFKGARFVKIFSEYLADAVQSLRPGRKDFPCSEFRETKGVTRYGRFDRNQLILEKMMSQKVGLWRRKLGSALLIKEFQKRYKNLAGSISTPRSTFKKTRSLFTVEKITTHSSSATKLKHPCSDIAAQN